MKINLQQYSDLEIWALFALSKKELRKRGLVRTSNITGERGEFLATEIYCNTPGLPNLQKAPEGTQNVDALSRKGERYSIKTITSPSKTTGVFYGIEKEDLNPIQKFEYLIIVVLDVDMNPINIYQIDWKTFLKHKRWHSRMKAFNISLNKNFINDSKIII